MDFNEREDSVPAADWLSTRRRPTPRPSINNGTDGALTALAIAIRRCDRDGLGRERLHPLVLDDCAHARLEGLAPEQMLVRLKHTLDSSWSLIAETPATQEEARATIIKTAIDAYYDDRS